MVEVNRRASLVLPTKLNEVNLKAWSDVDDVQTISFSLHTNDW